MSQSTASPSHPEELTRMDAGYLIRWGRQEIQRSLSLGLIACLVVGALTRYVSPWWGAAYLVILPVLGLLVLFFRNPRREVPALPGLLVSPADGTITDITEVEEPLFLREPSVRIGIFLSIFSVHVNRAPAAGVVEWVEHRDGAHHDARRPECATENESNWIGFRREDRGGPQGLKLLVKQVSGAIARRIICPLRPGAQVTRGGLVGMIKYGSRTELYIPRSAGARILVQPGAKVSGGSSVLAELPGA